MIENGVILFNSHNMYTNSQPCMESREKSNKNATFLQILAICSGIKMHFCDH